MKTTLLCIISLLASTIIFSQSGINYKAIIKDGGGNILVSQAVDLQFIIYEGAALTNNVYQESHTTNTDANGIVIVNIGEGTTTDVFTDVDWGNDEHWLNVQVNTGAGLVDLGTTQFMAVPYALVAEKASNVTGLEALDEGGGFHGWRLIGQNPQLFGDIGIRAVDLSVGAGVTNSTNGATGNYSFAAGLGSTASGFASIAIGYGAKATMQYSTAIGINPQATGFASISIGNGTIASGGTSTAIGYGTQASAYASTAFGGETIASGDYSTAFGGETIASGNYSTSLGYNSTAASAFSVVIGRYNLGGGDPINWLPTDPLFEIGNGMGFSARSNAFTVLKNGDIGVVTSTPVAKLHISEGNDTGLGANNGYLLLGETSGANISLDDNEIMAKNNGVAADLNLQIEGGNVLIGGNVGIGTINPEELLHVDGIVRIGTETIEDTGLNLLSFDANLLPSVNNGLSLGTTDFRWTTVYATNGTINTSDRREKKNIKNLDYGLAEVLQMQPVSFNWKDKNNPDIKLGLIAQELQELIPEVVKSHRWEKDEVTGALTKKELARLGVYYSDLVPVLIKAIQEQQKIIETERSINTIQNTRLEALILRIANLEAKQSN